MHVNEPDNRDGEVSVSIGEVDTVTAKKIAGWITADLPPETAINLSIAGIPIRSHRAEHPDAADPEKKRFSFLIGEKLSQMLPVDAGVDVRLAKTKALPFAEGTRSLYPGKATDQGAELRSLLADKWHIDHWGNMHVAFGRDPSLLEKCGRIYALGRELIRTELNRELYVTGGNLLGLVREGKFLDHDDDIDASMILQADSPDQAAEEFFRSVRQLAPAAKAAGLKLKVASPLHFYVIKPGLPYLDVLVGWLTSEGYWCRPSGYGGDIGVKEFEFEEIAYAGTSMAIPKHARTELVLTYGDSWSSKDEQYSKVRPAAPLQQVNELKHKYKTHVEELNQVLSVFFEKEA